MGKEAEVRAIFADGEDSGRLQYEPPKLIFRGRDRRVFADEALRQVRAEGDDLVLSDGARFRLGEKAARSWAAAILNPKGRLDKLGVKPGLRIATVNLDDADFAAELEAAEICVTDEPAGLDLLFYGADSPAELAAIGDLAPRLVERGGLWIVSLKGKLARIKDVEVMAAARTHGLVDIKVCAFSETRTALKLVRRRAPAG
jgi:hypothetical protein